MKQYVSGLIDLINVEQNQSHVGVITFSNQATIEFQLDAFRTRSEIKNKILEIPYSRGSTNSAEALKVAREQLFEYA